VLLLLHCFICAAAVSTLRKKQGIPQPAAARCWSAANLLLPAAAGNAAPAKIHTYLLLKNNDVWKQDFCVWDVLFL
jgi:hypothetical protein